MRNHQVLLFADVLSGKRDLIAFCAHSRVVVITSLFARPTWQNGGQRARR